MTTEEIKSEVASHRKEGTLDIFYREMRNLPIATEDAAFASENFRYYRELHGYIEIAQNAEADKIERRSNIDSRFKAADIAARRIRDHEILNMIICDPAKTVKMQSADSAIMCVGIHKETQRIFIRECRSGKFYPDELYRNMFEMVVKWKAGVLGVEVTSLEEFIVQPIENEMRFRNIHVIFEKLKARAKKELRIAALVPYYRNGYIYHNIEDSGKLEKQLMSYPRSKLWDLMDCEAYLIPLMDKLMWMFDPMGEDIELGTSEHEYKQLMNESSMDYAQLL
jgi:hypothetical protein